eukprot:4885855-Prymnesium_polylepis.3
MARSAPKFARSSSRVSSALSASIRPHVRSHSSSSSPSTSACTARLRIDDSLRACLPRACDCSLTAACELEGRCPSAPGSVSPGGGGGGGGGDGGDDERVWPLDDTRCRACCPRFTACSVDAASPRSRCSRRVLRPRFAACSLVAAACDARTSCRACRPRRAACSFAAAASCACSSEGDGSPRPVPPVPSPSSFAEVGGFFEAALGAPPALGGRTTGRSVFGLLREILGLRDRPGLVA